MPDVIIRDEPAFVVAAVSHRGAYRLIGEAFARHWSLIVANDMIGKYTYGVGFYYDNPSVVPEGELRSHAGTIIETGMPLPDAFERLKIPGGRTAVLTYRGPYSAIKSGWDQLYDVWLPASGEQAADLAPYERYLNAPHDTASEDLLTEICLPLKG